MKRILILMSKTGNGHNKIAETLRDTIEELYPKEYKIKIVDVFEDYANLVLKKSVTPYEKFVKHAPTIYALGFYTTDNKPSTMLLEHIMATQTHKKLEKLISTFRPDLVISTHPMVNRITSRILKRAHIPFVILITDIYNVHQFWFDRNATLHIAPNKYIEDQCKRKGLTNVITYPIPVSSKFGEKVKKSEIYKNYQLTSKKMTILITSGGNATVKASKIIQELDGLYNKYQVIVVNGRNDKEKERIEKVNTKIKIVNLGFIDNMHELMSIADIVLAKAGAVTMQEIFTKRKVSIIIEHIKGHESENLKFIKKENLAIISHDDIVKEILRITRNKDRMKEIQDNEKKFSDVKSRIKIVNKILPLIENENTT